MRRGGADLRVMFHEPYFYFTLARPLRNLLALAQRHMAAVLLRGGGVVYVSTDSWIEYLRPYAPVRTDWTVLSIPSTVDPAAPAAAIERWRRSAGGGPVVGHFGTYGDHVAKELEPVVVALLESDPAVHVLLLGRNGDEFAARLVRTWPGLANRVHASGALPEAEVAAALAACDVLVQPYPDGVTTRRTSVMAGLAAGVATVTTQGRLTERVWRETQAVVLAPASDVTAMRDSVIALLSDDVLRQRQAEHGRRAYDERFAIDRSVDVLLRA
jgi:glycosyltransferase involved in cell wall biosynthesis